MTTRGAAAGLLLAAAAGVAAPVRETDPLMVGTKWSGTLTQAGTFPERPAGPPAFRTELTVTKRAGDLFWADLRERTDTLDITYVVKGEVVRAADGRGYAVAFRSVDAKDVVNTYPLLGIPYSGTAAGRTLKGVWRYTPPEAAAALKGEFNLELTK